MEKETTAQTCNATKNRLAIIAIMVENLASASKVNELLSACGSYIIGRMGIPYHAKNLNVISIVLDAPQEITNSLTGKLGMVEGITAKTLFSKV